MTHVVNLNQIPIGTLPDQQAAERALDVLQKAGFQRTQMEVLPQSPKISETKSWESAIQAATIGALTGAVVGLGTSYMKILVANDPSVINPLSNIIAMVLISSLMGGAALGLIGAMTGSNLRKRSNGEVEAVSLAPKFLVLAKNMHPEETQRAKEILQQQGAEVN